MVVASGPGWQPLARLFQRGVDTACADADCGNEAKAIQSSSKVVDFARSLQGFGQYPGVDEYTEITLKKGTIIYGGSPGQSNFYTTVSAIEKSGRNAQKIWRGLQVAPNDKYGYRSWMTAYEVTEDVVVAVGKALANPNHGAGGLPQIVVENYDKVLRPLVSIRLQ